MFVLRGATSFDDLILAILLVSIVIILIIVPFMTSLAVPLKRSLGVDENGPLPVWVILLALVVLVVAFFFILHGFP